MFKPLIFATASLLGGSGLYLRYNKLQLENQSFRKILQTLHAQNSKYSELLMKFLIKSQIIKRNRKLQNYVLHGFDFDGYYLQALSQLGFNTVEIGPVSLIPSCQQETRRHLGCKIAISNINTYKQKIKLLSSKNTEKPSTVNNGAISQNISHIGVSIAPNFQVLNYTPYLIEENVLECLKQFEVLNEDKPIISRYILKFSDKITAEQNSKQFFCILKSAIENCHDLVNATFQVQCANNGNIKNTQAVAQEYRSQKPSIFIEIPSKSENTKLFEVVTSARDIKHLIIDDTQYQVSKDKKNNVRLDLGLRRVSLPQLIQKIIHQSL